MKPLAHDRINHDRHAERRGDRRRRLQGARIGADDDTLDAGILERASRVSRLRLAIAGQLRVA